jgi:hypothetical protein
MESLTINYSEGRVTSINKTFNGEFKGRSFEIYANWNEWDEWAVENIMYLDTSLSEEMDSETYGEIESAFLDEMYQ